MIDWAARYASGDTPWDLGGPHPELLRRLAAGELKRTGAGRAFVPGCGRGYDAAALARHGWRVTAIDLHDVLTDASRAAIGRGGGRFTESDALAWQDEPYDLVLEHTFFCALPPTFRSDWGRMMKRLLATGGMLAAIVFPIGRSLADGGPPWGIDAGAILSELTFPLTVVADEPVRQPGHRRGWGESWLAVERA